MTSLTHNMMTLDQNSVGALNLSFSPDGHLIACSTIEPLIGIWNVSTRHLVMELDRPSNPRARPRALAWSKDGSRIASGCGDNIVRIWNAENSAHLRSVVRPSQSRALAFHPNRYHLLASGEDKVSGHNGARVALINCETGEETLQYQAGPWVHSFGDVTFSPDGERVVAGGVDIGRLCSWHIGAAEPFWIVWAHRDSVDSLGYSPDGLSIATGGDDGVVRLWQAHSGRLVHELTGHLIAGRNFQPFIEGMAFSPDGKLLASGSQDHSVRLWNTSSEDVAQIISVPDIVSALAFSPDGSTLAIAVVNNPVQIWHVS